MSCVCLTYGRPALLEEAIHSFLIQDYPGQRELIVLNDYPRQCLVCDAPGVHVVNVPRRFRTVGEKLNAAVALAAHDLLFVWDDDDIYLPHRLSLSVERFDPARGFFKAATAWLSDQGVLSGPVSNVFHAGSCWSRELFDSVGGYAAMGNGYDQEIEGRFEAVRPGSTAACDLPPAALYYLYRWGATGSFHMSGYGPADPASNVEYTAVAEFVEAEVRAGRVPLGRITLTPRWRADYTALVHACLHGR